MKKTNSKMYPFILLAVFLLITSTSFGQLPGFDDTQNDSQPAPISSVVALGLIAGAAFGVKKLK